MAALKRKVGGRGKSFRGDELQPSATGRLVSGSISFHGAPSAKLCADAIACKLSVSTGAVHTAASFLSLLSPSSTRGVV